MSDQAVHGPATSGARAVPVRRGRAKSQSGWAGWVYFGGMMMIMLGVFNVIEGLVALFNDEFFVSTSNYTFNLDVTGWGVIHLIIGLVALFTSYGLFTQAPWAGITAMVICTLSAIANFFFIPYSPFLSITLIAIDVWVIWSITRPGGMRSD